MIGEKLSPILVNIEESLLEFEANAALKPGYTDDGFRAAIKIFMSTLLDKMYNLQEEENMEIKNRILMAEKAGEDFRNFIKNYTDIDTFKLY